MPQSPGSGSHPPLAKGEVFDRPPFELALDWLWNEFEVSKLAFDDAFKDATRHDQVQLFDSMVARGSDFLRLGRNFLATESQPDAEGHTILHRLKKELLSFDLNQGDILQREEKLANAVDYMVGELHRAGYVIAKRKAVVVPSDYALAR